MRRLIRLVISLSVVLLWAPQTWAQDLDLSKKESHERIQAWA